MSDLGLRATSFVGLLVMIGIAWLLSSDRKAIRWRLVGVGTGLQLVFGVLVLRTRVGLAFFAGLNDGVGRLLEFTAEGSRFVFGAYLDEHFTVALNVLPTVLFFSALMAVLYHLGVMQRVVGAVAWVMQRTLGTSGAETLSAAANIFVGQTEAPLVVRPYVDAMTKSELMAVMVGGFATVAGGVMAAYVGMLRESFPDIAGHLIAASVLSAPAGLVVAKILLPETGTPVTHGRLEFDGTSPYTNLIDAAATGASDGLKLALNVGAMLLVFTALVALANYLVALPATLHNQALWPGALAAAQQHAITLPALCDASMNPSELASCLAMVNAQLPHGAPRFEVWNPWSFELVLGWLGWPLAFVMGVPGRDCEAVSALLGQRIVLNEFVAYVGLARNLEGSTPMSPRAATIVTYALCGFANFSSIAIQVGGIGALAPGRRQELAQLGLRAMVGGVLASYMTACVAGILA